MASRRLSENHPVTPDNSTTLSGSSRSRKCLDMALKSNKKVASPMRGSPLSDRNNLPHPTLITPTKHAPNQPPSPTSSSKFILSSSDHSRSPSPEVASLSTPLFIPKTPQPELRRPLLSKVSIPSPAVKRAPMAVSTKKKSSPPPNSTTSSAAIPTIITTSFYSTKSSTTTPQPSAPPSRLALSQPPLRRSNSGGSLRRHRSRSSGGASKRKRGHSGGVGHNIKKPKLRHKAESSKPMKISSLTALSVELPSSKSSPRPSTSKASLTPTSGQLNLSKQTKVQFEVKGGQFVYRTKAKTATTPKTPLRRSPRKNFSPLKADYFSSCVKERGKGKGGKLFSPNANYLNPERLSPDKRGIPSPVKFDSSAQEDPHNLSELITSLAKDQVGELAISVMSGETAVIEDPSTTTPQFSSLTGNIPDISLAVSNILNDLSSGDDSLTDAGGDTSASSVDQQADTPQPSSSSKLFPIFCKTTAKSGEDSGITTTSFQSHGKRFLCSSLSDSQTIIDAGQKEIGPTLCLTCGTVYTVGDPEDEGHHEQLHSGLLDKLKLPVWKTERVVGQFPAGRVLCVRPGDHGSHWKKVEEALSVVDRDLGFSEVGIRWPEKTKVFLFVADKKIVGFLLAESIEEGYKILPNKDSEVTGKVYCCSEAPHPVKCGISRVWVLADYRRNKVASSLVDCMRSSFFQNHYLKDTEFAFSDPTLNGIEFAASYMRSQEFLVYNR
eukprot:GFUD01113206.1.p1 GENE.GFUD01113206.1~~GFUD01113206.1.p1  ORF type:complete len:736 (+),score=212.28 GFUD01113206.1:43-2208(+)